MTTSPSMNWHEDVFFGVHYDLHAEAGDTVLGKELTVEHIVERLSRVRPDWVQCDCKGHPGYTSWPTTVGSTSPGVVNDGLRIHREATKQLGIRLGVHYSGVWDSRAIELHPEWARIDERGRPDGPHDEPDSQVLRSDMTCRLSAYADELMIPQMREIIDTYDVDGFWVDGENWASKPCWCARCRAEFSRRTGHVDVPTAADQPFWEEWLAFHRDLFVEYIAHYADAVHAHKPGCLVCSNWMYSARQPDQIHAPVDYLSGDYDWAWGSNRAAIEGRVLSARGLSWDLMAWAFTKTGPMTADPPWTLKPVLHLCQEAAEVVALGGAVMVYNQPQRTGWLTGWHQDTIAAVADFCRARQDTCFKSTTVPQAAILHLDQHYYAHNSPLFNYGAALQPVEGALHALLETGRSTDVLTADAALRSLQHYRLVVVPEQTRLSEPLLIELEAYARSGGHLVLSGVHLSRDYPDLVGARPDGDLIHDPTYLPVDDRAVSVSASWQAVRPDSTTEAWVHRLAEQEPAKDTTAQVIVTRRTIGTGSIVAIHGPIFQDYLAGHYPDLRQFIANLIARLDINWMVEVVGSHRLEVVLRRKEEKLLVNLINRGAGEALSPHRVIVEELPAVSNVVVRIRHTGPPRSVTILPPQPSTDWSYDNGTIVINALQVAVHSVIVVE